MWQDKPLVSIIFIVMSSRNDALLRRRISRILERIPNASSQMVRQRLMMSVKPTQFYVHLIPFYEQQRIDDNADITKALGRMMAMHLGLSVIARTLTSRCYNHRQVEAALLELTANFDHLEQARRCKEAAFGVEPPKDANHQSQMVMHLQKQGHRLPDIWQVLRQDAQCTSR